MPLSSDVEKSCIENGCGANWHSLGRVTCKRSRSYLDLIFHIKLCEVFDSLYRPLTLYVSQASHFGDWDSGTYAVCERKTGLFGSTALYYLNTFFGYILSRYTCLSTYNLWMFMQEHGSIMEWQEEMRWVNCQNT